jgi:hypothetical protein
MTDSTTAAAQDSTAAVAEAAQSDSSIVADVAPETTAVTEAVTEQAAAVQEYADFTLAEGQVMDEAMLTDFKGIAKELGIPQEGAQKLVDLQSALEARRVEAVKKQVEQWGDQCRSDKVLGGDQLEKTLAITAGIVAQAEKHSPGFRDLLTESGYGNHPVFMRAFYGLGKSLTEDSVVLGGTQVTKEMSLVEAFS